MRDERRGRGACSRERTLLRGDYGMSFISATLRVMMLAAMIHRW